MQVWGPISLIIDSQKALADLDAWISRANVSLVSAFANGVSKDKAAIEAAIALPWSNGQTEGQVCKLKLVKRQMYGRVNLDLLQARVLASNRRWLHRNCVIALDAREIADNRRELREPRGQGPLMPPAIR